MQGVFGWNKFIAWNKYFSIERNQLHLQFSLFIILKEWDKYVIPVPCMTLNSNLEPNYLFYRRKYFESEKRRACSNGLYSTPLSLSLFLS